MKGKIILTVVYAFTLFSSCSGGMAKGVWVDDHTFRISGTGYPGSNAASSVEKKLRACEAARLDALSKLIERFAETGIKSIKGAVTVTEFKNIVRKEFSAKIKGVPVVKSFFDENSNRCVVVCEIKEKDLKQKVLNLAAKVKK